MALVDVVPEYLAAARELTGLPESACYTRLEGALEAVPSDAVVVASPVTLHAAQILSGLRAGRHVLTEKCFTVGLADAVACVEAAERHGRCLMVVQNARLSPPMRTLRRLIAEGTYGPLGLFTQTFWKARGGPYNLSPHMHLWQQGVHELDTLLAVLQRPVRRVWGLSSSPAWCDWPTPSTVQAVLECEGGLSGTHLSTSNARAGGFEMRLECAEAALVARDRTWGPIEVHWGPGGRRSETLPPDAPDTRGLEQHPTAREALADPQAAGRRPGAPDRHGHLPRLLRVRQRRTGARVPRAGAICRRCACWTPSSAPARPGARWRWTSRRTRPAAAGRGAAGTAGMTPLRVAVIGAGNIAQQHLPVLLAHPDCEVALLCDSDPATLAETAQRLRSRGGTVEGGGEGELRHPELVTDVGDVLRRDDLDAVFVLVSVLAVSAVAGACLEAGLPTFVEKPPGIASAETARLAELQQRRGTVAVVGLNRRFYSSHLAARERLLALGPLATVTVEAHEDLARVSREKFPPLVLRRWAYANGIHALDLLRFFGGEVTEVVSRQETVEGPFPDSFSALLRFASGASGRAAVDWMAPGRHRFEVRGVGARATSLGGLGSTELALRGREPEVLEPDDDDRRFKAGFWKQDGAFLAGVRAGRQPPFPSPPWPTPTPRWCSSTASVASPPRAEGEGG